MNDLALFPTILSADDEVFLGFKTEQIRAIAVGAVIEIGKHLIEAKDRVGHGHFLTWLAKDFPQWSIFRVDEWMRIARGWSDLRISANLNQTVMLLLAGPTVPEEARKDAVNRAEAGEQITIKEAEAMIAQKSREVIERTVAEFRANQQEEIDEAVAVATRDLMSQLQEERSAHWRPLDVEGLCKAIEKNLNITRMSPSQYRLLAQLLGQRIAVGKTGYDPVSEETIKQNTENLRITASITEALQALAAAPAPETIVASAYPVQLSQHQRVCRQVIDWLEHYADMLDAQGEIHV